MLYAVRQHFNLVFRVRAICVLFTLKMTSVACYMQPC